MELRVMDCQLTDRAVEIHVRDPAARTLASDSRAASSRHWLLRSLSRPLRPTRKAVHHLFTPASPPAWLWLNGRALGEAITALRRGEPVLIPDYQGGALAVAAELVTEENLRRLRKIVQRPAGMLITRRPAVLGAHAGLGAVRCNRDPRLFPISGRCHPQPRRSLGICRIRPTDRRSLRHSIEFKP